MTEFAKGGRVEGATGDKPLWVLNADCTYHFRANHSRDSLLRRINEGFDSAD